MSVVASDLLQAVCKAHAPMSNSIRMTGGKHVCSCIRKTKHFDSCTTILHWPLQLTSALPTQSNISRTDGGAT